ncbi:MAG TPA: hypothetical protein VGR63_19355 [Casimicrobiaceae bacterium]|jgi:hypothetical protein|nr:hypothetical protein [Casimicrobiaceae bacterium]
MERASVFIANGLIALALALLLWRLTHNFAGWLALFAPGSALVLRGVYLIMRDEQ